MALTPSFRAAWPDTPDEVLKNWEALKLRKKNRKGGILGRLLVAFQYRPSFLKIPRIFLNALLG